MQADRFLWAVLWALVTAVPFALLGAAFGACARFAGKWFNQVSDGSIAKTLQNGSAAGGIFLGIAGFALGGMRGLSDSPAGAMLEATLAAVLALALLMLGALVLGGLVFVLQRLGTEWSIVGIGLFASGLFLGLPIRRWIFRTWLLDDRELGELTHVLIWATTVGVGVAILVLLGGALWILQRALAGAVRLLTGRRE